MKIALAPLLCGSAILISLMPIAADEMNMVKLHVDAFTVVGVEARTTNAREMSADGVIPKIWGRFRNENLLGAIPKRVDSHIVALYTDYESDKDGPYTYLLGAKVSSAKDIPPGMVSRAVIAGAYAMFTEQGGPPPQMIVDLWKRIWSLEKPGQFQRAYKTDFEVYYDGLVANPPNTHVDVYVGLRK
ncbi:MAG: GyrI-like domain-containing protein [Bryobacteraceae bacterium]